MASPLKDGKHAFTLVELLLVLALFGLLSSLAVSHFDKIQMAFESYKGNPVWILKQGIQKMRFLASQGHRDVRLVWTEQGLQLTDENAELIESFAFPKSFNANDVTVEFYKGKYSDKGSPRITHQKLSSLMALQDASLMNAYIKVKWHDMTDLFRVDSLTGGLVSAEVL